MEISVCQFYTPNVSYGKYSEKINEQYCQENGYNYFVEKDGNKIKSKIPGRSFTWYKPHLIRETLERYPNSDYVLFLDIDAIFCNNTRRIEEFIKSDFSILMTHDYGPSLVNAGVMLVRNDEFTKKFLQEWWDICEEYPQYKEGLWHDQTCIGLVYDKLSKPANFVIIDNFDFNAREYNDNRFIFHAFSYGLSPHRTIDTIYNNKFNIVDTKKREKIKAIVYHIFCVGNYLDIVSEQIKKIKESGLYDWCDIMEITCVDLQEKYEGIDSIFAGMTKVKINKINQNRFEYWAITKVWELSQDYDGQVFYFHAKGVSNNYVNLKTKEISDWKQKSIRFWREMLEYFLIDNFRECLNKLETKDTCGVTCNDGWFWGNFWWSNLEYVRKNIKPETGDRWYFEAWLNRGRQVNCHEFYKFNFNPYFTQLPVEIYKDTNKLKGKEITIESASYGSLGIQLDEGYPEDTPLVQTDVTEIVRNHLRDNKLLVRVDNSVFGDPIHGHRKFLVVNIKIGGEPYKLVYSEGVTGNFELI